MIDPSNSLASDAELDIFNRAPHLNEKVFMHQMRESVISH
jgi:hypothetical protein